MNPSVEQRQPLDRPSPAADRARPYVDPRQVEPFLRRHRAGRARLLHEPRARRVVDVRARAMDSLTLVILDDAGDALERTALRLGG